MTGHEPQSLVIRLRRAFPLRAVLSSGEELVGKAGPHTVNLGYWLTLSRSPGAEPSRSLTCGSGRNPRLSTRGPMRCFMGSFARQHRRRMIWHREGRLFMPHLARLGVGSRIRLPDLARLCPSLVPCSQRAHCSASNAISRFRLPIWANWRPPTMAYINPLQWIARLRSRQAACYTRACSNLMRRPEALPCVALHVRAGGSLPQACH